MQRLQYDPKKKREEKRKREPEEVEKKKGVRERYLCLRRVPVLAGWRGEAWARPPARTVSKTGPERPCDLAEKAEKIGQ